MDCNQFHIAESDSVQDMMFMSEIMDARETIDEAEEPSQVEALFEENEGEHIPLIPFTGLYLTT